MKISRIFSIYFLFTCLFIFVLGCSAAKREMRAYIDDSRQWKIIEKCGYENCYPIVDYLTSDNMTIELELINDHKQGIFRIKTYFVNTSKPCKYRPSQIRITLKNGEILKPKALTCRYTISNVEYLRSYSPLSEPIMIEKEGCYLLFFDHPPLSPEEELIMDMKNAVIINGEKSDLPIIYFKKKENK